jgi:hypothetical protein
MGVDLKNVPFFIGSLDCLEGGTGGVVFVIVFVVAVVVAAAVATGIVRGQRTRF